MQPSDFLTILGLALAVWSIIPKKERSFLRLFFSNGELICLAVGLLLIHYLMAFDWLKENWFKSLSVFTVEKGIPPTTWAYILALLIISLPILKVTFYYFSGSKVKALISLYRSLLKENEIDLLVSYINRYHIHDIQKYLIGLSHLQEKENIDLILRRRTEADEAYEKLIKPKRIKFAAWVYGHILTNEHFIKKAATKYPELFATAFRGMETKRASNQDTVKLYIECLFESKNQSLVSELKIANDGNDSIRARDEHVDLPILYGLFANTEAAAENYVWYPVGEGAIKALKYDNEQGEFLKKKYDADIEPELWNHKIWIATVYFNYMVRETIYRDGGWHMWLFYFRSTTDQLIENIPEDNDYDVNSEYPSFAHYILYRQFDVMLDWLELAEKLKTDNRVIDTIRCLGWCIHSFCQADDRKISVEFKKARIERIISIYCECAYHDDNIACTTTRDWLKRLFHNPKGVDFGAPEIAPEYLTTLSEAWNDFDKVPYEYHGDGWIIEDFENEILQPLGIL